MKLLGLFGLILWSGTVPAQQLPTQSECQLPEGIESYPSWCQDVMGEQGRCMVDAHARRGSINAIERVARLNPCEVFPQAIARHVIACELARQNLDLAALARCARGVSELRNFETLVVIPRHRSRQASLPPSGARVVVECNGRAHLQISESRLRHLNHVLVAANLRLALAVATQLRSGRGDWAAGVELSSQLRGRGYRVRLQQMFQLVRPAYDLPEFGLQFEAAGAGSLPLAYAGTSCVGEEAAAALPDESWHPSEQRRWDEFWERLNAIRIPTTFGYNDYLVMQNLRLQLANVCEEIHGIANQVANGVEESAELIARCSQLNAGISAYIHSFAQRFRDAIHYEERIRDAREMGSQEWERHNLFARGLEARARGSVTAEDERAVRSAIERCRMDPCGCRGGGLFWMIESWGSQRYGHDPNGSVFQITPILGDHSAVRSEILQLADEFRARFENSITHTCNVHPTEHYSAFAAEASKAVGICTDESDPTRDPRAI